MIPVVNFNFSYLYRVDHRWLRQHHFIRPLFIW